MTKILSREYPKILYSYRDFKFYLVLCQEKQTINNEVSYDIRMSLVEVPDYVKRNTDNTLLIYFDGPFYYGSFKNERSHKENNLLSILIKRKKLYEYIETEQEFLNRTLWKSEKTIDKYIEEVNNHKKAFENICSGPYTYT